MGTIRFEMDLIIRKLRSLQKEGANAWLEIRDVACYVQDILPRFWRFLYQSLFEFRNDILICVLAR